MHQITFISTIHKEIGNCNAEELYKIIEKLSPEVIFLEAVNDTYSGYEKILFSTWGQFHKKLEIAAIQKYDLSSAFVYVPVCENSLSDAFHRKIKIVFENREMQQLIDNYHFLAEKQGFKFLNSLESINLQEEMRALESRILSDTELDEIVKADIEAYENPMIRNIYSYSNNNHFSSAIFMCGVAHRKSIIEKIEKYKTEEQGQLTWTIFEGRIRTR
jgi:hypothetical protein